MTTELNDLQTAVLEDRYTLKGKDGESLEHTWGEVVTRTTTAIAKGDEPWVLEAFKEMLQGMYFIPAGRILASIGAPYELTPYNCFVLPSPVDSRGGLVDSFGLWIEIQSRSGGVGMNFSTLRPRGSRVQGVNGTSSGAVNWMKPFSVVTSEVIQQGGSRRGAAMMILDDNHPDVLEFIEAKKTPGQLVGANLSVNISDHFMQAVEYDKEWDLHWDGTVFNTIPARELWDKIMQAAWASGEPGVVFLGRANKMSNSWYFENIIATNPCAEKPMAPWGCCLLGSVNLAMHVKNGQPDLELIEQTVALATRLLDNIIDNAYYPEPIERFNSSFEAHQKKVRQIGIGTMGLADMLAMCGVRYGSPEAMKIVRDVFRTIKNASYLESTKLAKARGSFPAYIRDSFLDSGFVKDSLNPLIQGEIYRWGIRNCLLTSQAPTGTIGKLAGVAEGIEPFFSKKIGYKNRLGTSFTKEIPYEDPGYAHELTAMEHIAIMEAVQDHTDSAVSKTVNAPKEETVEGTSQVYRYAYERGLKSIAYYRNESRGEQVQHVIEEEVVDPLSDSDCPTCDNDAVACDVATAGASTLVSTTKEGRLVGWRL